MEISCRLFIVPTAAVAGRQLLFFFNLGNSHTNVSAESLSTSNWPAFLPLHSPPHTAVVCYFTESYVTVFSYLSCFFLLVFFLYETVDSCWQLRELSQWQRTLLCPLPVLEGGDLEASRLFYICEELLTTETPVWDDSWKAYLGKKMSGWQLQDLPGIEEELVNGC